MSETRSKSPETISSIEENTIQQVPLDQRHGKNRDMFTIWFGTNIMILAIVTGALATTVFGQPAWSAVLAIVLGNLFGAIFMALHSAQGPTLGVPQMVQTKGQFPLAQTLWEPGDNWRDGFGANFHPRLASTFGRYTEWGITTEDLPDESNTVTLDPNVTDSDGIPAAKIHYTIGENCQRMLEFNVARAVEAHQAAGAVDVHPIPVVRHSAWHLLGTTKMGTDPATSVVDEWCRTHDIPNLFIIDGSTMVTSTGMNPTATIMAVALRSARHLAETRSSIPTAF